ncbi:MAG: hypothetical protein GXP46_01640 [Deferribacteres bacterium]|nr:hypothetical protein [Deferribacteres bacterium]
MQRLSGGILCCTGCPALGRQTIPPAVPFSSPLGPTMARSCSLCHLLDDPAPIHTISQKTPKDKRFIQFQQQVRRCREDGCSGRPFANEGSVGV